MSTEKYRIVVRYSTPKEAFEALAPEIPGCEAEGATRAEALANLEQELVAQLENMEAQGVEPPQPLDLQEFDGQISATISSELHRELTFHARETGLELPALVAELLARQAGGGGGGSRRGRPAEGRGGRRGGPPGQRYHDIMDNRENFIEYVRSLDGGGGGPSGRRGGGGRRSR